MLYVFGDYTLDTQGYALCRAGTPVHGRPKVFQGLAYLLAHRDRVVPKPELLAHVWPGQSVSDEALDSCIALARRAVGDNARVQGVIHTRHGYGHRFVAAVEVRGHPPLADEAPAVALTSSESPAPARGPGLVVAPRPEAARFSVTAPPVSPAPPRQRPPAGEQKLVTVLLCTLAHAAALAQRLEAEAWHQAMQALCACILEEVQRYGGTLQHLLDDGALVLFGAPVAQEDHARRAVRAALGLQQRLQRFHVDPAWPSGEAGAVRLGLHTGRILLGSLGEELRLTYTAVGDTTQRAAGLAQQAAPGTILVSAATARLVHGEVRLEACAPGPRLALGDMLNLLGEHGRRLALLGEAEARARALDDRARLGWVLTLMTHARRITGDLNGAIAVGLQAIELAVEVGESALQRMQEPADVIRCYQGRRTPCRRNCCGQGLWARMLEPLEQRSSGRHVAPPCRGGPHQP